MSFSDQLKKLPSGELTISAEDSTLLYVLPSSVKKFVAMYPGIRLKLTDLPEHGSCDSVLSEASDFAVSPMLNVPDNLAYESIASYTLVLITPKDHPLTQLPSITLEDIAEYGLIIPPQQFSSRYLVKTVFALSGINYKVSLEVGGWVVIKKYVSLGLGISIVSKSCIEEADSNDFAIFDLGGFFPSHEYGIVSKLGKSLSSPAQKFIEILRMETGNTPTNIS